MLALARTAIICVSIYRGIDFIYIMAVLIAIYSHLHTIVHLINLLFNACDMLLRLLLLHSFLSWHS